ncbi:MAG: hypothetical protein GC203_01235 [Phenylobacterium sp.]|uniref:hypothetical protein n=1 Tax=Phenylobacterium sp. TaxID=1871053 RepID=UPI0025EDF471|nr:hypothetical protein [Phenylobacterium sp.]MBI1196467.1 hypothetical protein [Phenylobacterium sp.]
MIRAIIGGAVAVALLPGSAAVARPPAPAWIVTPAEAGCRAELELRGRSGGVTPLTVLSDGELVSLRFSKDGLPARAFLPVRIDKARFSNLMLRGDDGSGELVLSEETEAALRRGGTLDIAWLADEPRSVSLAGSDQGLADLRVCGAQAASRHRERQAAEAARRDRAETEARARALNEAQLAAVQAQAAAAEAQRQQADAQRQQAEAQRRQAEAAAERDRRAVAEADAQAYEAARRQAYEESRRQAYERQFDDEEQDRWAPQPRTWPPARWRDPY